MLILKGNMNISWNDRTENMKRKNPFEKTPYCLHVCKGIKISIEACEDSEFLVQQTDNEREFEPVFYKPEDCFISISAKVSGRAQDTVFAQQCSTMTMLLIPTW